MAQRMAPPGWCPELTQKLAELGHAAGRLRCTCAMQCTILTYHSVSSGIPDDLMSRNTMHNIAGQLG
eukprot:2728098-Rhodomonas_salina.2